MVRDWPAMLAVGAGIFVAMATASNYHLPVDPARAVALALPLSVPWSDNDADAAGQPAGSRAAMGDGASSARAAAHASR